jgi:hypothetical protein
MYDQDDPCKRERNGGREERKAMVAAQCQRGRPGDGPEDYHDRGCRGPFEIKVDVFEHGRLPR